MAPNDLKELTERMEATVRQAFFKGYEEAQTKRDKQDKEGLTEAVRQISHQQVVNRDDLLFHLKPIKEQIEGIQVCIVVAAGILSAALPFFCWLLGVGTKH